jgi:hypothetical protein
MDGETQIGPYCHDADKKLKFDCKMLAAWVLPTVGSVMRARETTESSGSVALRSAHSPWPQEESQHDDRYKDVPAGRGCQA